MTATTPDLHDVMARWDQRFDPLSGGVAIGDPNITKQMRWLPPGTVLRPCQADRVLHGVLDRCGQPAGHPGDLHQTSTGVVFELDDDGAAMDGKQR